jgi:DNA repair exonuclease SbcCD nuclease subunit
MSRKPITICLTDLHVKPDNIPVIQDIIDQAIHLCEQLGVQIILFNGDMFVERDKQPMECLNAVMEMIQKIEDAGIFIFAIHGNHDQKDQDSSLSYLKLYTKFQNFFLIDTNRTVEMTPQLLYHFVPHFKDNEIYREQLLAVKANIKIDCKNILFTHKEFNGVRNNDGTVVTGSISPDEVKEFDSVMVGHYHDPSIVGTNVYFFGATIQHNFGESAEKGFAVLYDDGSFNIKRSHFPVFRKVKFNVVDLEKTFDEINAVLETIEENQYVRFVFVGSTTNIEALPVAELRDAGIDVKFERDDVITSDFTDVDDYKIMTFDKKSILKASLEYTQIQSFTPGQRSRFLLYIKEAKNVVVN